VTRSNPWAASRLVTVIVIDALHRNLRILAICWPGHRPPGRISERPHPDRVWRHRCAAPFSPRRLSSRRQGLSPRPRKPVPVRPLQIHARSAAEVP